MKMLFKILLAVLVVSVVISIAGVRKVKSGMEYWCQSAGEEMGTLAGTAAGSYQGYQEGIQKGTDDGRAEGLSAKDTTVTIENTVRNTGNLQVLNASVSLKNLNEIGDAYKSLYIASGKMIFTVNLQDAEIQVSENGRYTIKIPKPTFEVYLNQNSVQKLAETQKFSFTVKASDGIDAYLNTMKQSMKKLNETIANYDSLVQSAQDAAIHQVTQLVSVVAPQGSQIHVEFKK